MPKNFSYVDEWRELMDESDWVETTTPFVGGLISWVKGLSISLGSHITSKTTTAESLEIKKL